MTTTYGAATALTTAFNSMPNAAYADLGTIDFTSANVMDCLLEISAQASGATSGNQQLIIYARSSVDGTNLSDAYSSGNVRNLRYVGTVGIPDSAQHRSPAFSLATAFGGALPPKVGIVVVNDCGVGMAASNNAGQYRTIAYS